MKFTYKIFLSVILLSISNITFSQKWYKDIEEKSIPKNLSENTLLIIKFNSDKKNKKLDRITKRYYPYQYEIIDSSQLILYKFDSSKIILEHNIQNIVTESYVNNEFQTLRYKAYKYNFRTSTTIFEQIGIRSQSKLKTYKEIMKSIYFHQKKQKKIITIFATALPFRDDDYFTRYNLAKIKIQSSHVDKSIAYAIAFETGQEQIGGPKNKSIFYIIKPEIKKYLWNWSANKPNGFYLGASLNLYKGTKYNSKRNSSNQYQDINLETSFSLNFGYDIKILKHFVINTSVDFNLKLSSPFSRGRYGNYLEQHAGYGVLPRLAIGYTF